jgi:hypothetical protein
VNRCSEPRQVIEARELSICALCWAMGSIEVATHQLGVSVACINRGKVMPILTCEMHASTAYDEERTHWCPDGTEVPIVLSEPAPYTNPRLAAP